MKHANEDDNTFIKESNRQEHIRVMTHWEADKKLFQSLIEFAINSNAYSEADDRHVFSWLAVTRFDLARLQGEPTPLWWGDTDDDWAARLTVTFGWAVVQIKKGAEQTDTYFFRHNGSEYLPYKIPYLSSFGNDGVFNVARFKYEPGNISPNQWTLARKDNTGRITRKGVPNAKRKITSKVCRQF